MSYKDVVLSLLEKSSSIANNYFGNVDVSIKSGDSNQVLTRADLEIGNYIVTELQKNFPDHNVIDEESGIKDKGSKYTWVIDPIDGTGNFAVGLPLYGIIIGLIENDTPIVGGVAIPYFGQTYFAEKGKGAFRNNQHISVTEKRELLKTLVAYGMDRHQNDPDFTKKEMKILEKIVNNIQNLRASNSVYDAMMVAEGRFGGYVNQSMRIWDIVGPQVIIEEAGGLVTDIEGKPLTYMDPIRKANEHFTFLSSSKSLYPKLLSVIGKSLL